MKVKKILALVITGIVIFTGIANSAPVENALSECPEESVYMVLKLENAQEFMKWIFSRQNIDTFMPLILASEDSNDILGTIELLSAFAENTPLQSTAILVGLSGGEVPRPFFQMAFKVKPESEPIFKKIADCTAEPIDIAKLFLGNENPIATFVETMIKVEKADNNVLKIDNDVFLKAYEGMLIMGITESDIEASIKAIDHEDLRLQYKRKFSEKDFMLFHLDPKAAKILNDLDDDEDDDLNISKYIEKPLNVEFGFERVPEKFTVGMYANWKEAVKEKYYDRSFANLERVKPVKGSYVNLLGLKAPLIALGGYLDLGLVRDTNIDDKDFKEAWQVLTKNLRLRFGISEEILTETFKGAFSLSMGDNVAVENFKLPAIYSLTTTKPGKFFEILSKSQHLHKVQDGVLQIDSSISPVSFLIENKGDTLGMHFADLENISKKPEIKPALKEILNREGVSLCWIDFAQIQSWLFDTENSVMPVVEPLARITGYGEIFDAVKNLLSAELSVPSVAFIGDSFDTVHIEFDIAEINESNGLFSKMVEAAKKFKLLEEKTEQDKKAD